MERSPWYRDPELTGSIRVEVGNTPVAVWVQLHNALKRNTNYAIVTTVDDHWIKDAGDEAYLVGVHVDHANKKIELEFA